MGMENSQTLLESKFFFAFPAKLKASNHFLLCPRDGWEAGQLRGAHSVPGLSELDQSLLLQSPSQHLGDGVWASRPIAFPLL